jgi:serine/threonine protein kinase
MGGGISLASSPLPYYAKGEKEKSPTQKSFPLPASTRPLSFPLSLITASTPKLSHYFIGSIIGQGGFGKIHEIKRRKDDRWFALKSFEFENMTLRKAQAITTELLALNRIPSHPFVIQLHAAFRERSAISFVMDLLVGGDLRLLVGLGEKLDEMKIAYVVSCVGSALHHIHMHQVIHRDVKPENIMFTTRGIPKLIDFGIAHLSPPTSKICVCQSKSGTVQYMSPEALVPNTHCHGYESDFWSLGIVMYEMLYGCRPYETRVPSVLVEYSDNTYQVAWKSLLAQSATELDSRGVNLATSSTPTSTSTASPPISPSPGGVTRLPSFHPIFEEDDSPLPLPEVQIPLPEYSSVLNASPSQNCLSLLSSLLDVRIHKRCGVGENYSAFSEHAFFISQEISVKNILSVPSPIHPDLNKIGMHIWDQFYSANLDNEITNTVESTIPPVLLPEVEEFFQQIQANSPLFYESNCDSSK